MAIGMMNLGSENGVLGLLWEDGQNKNLQFFQALKKETNHCSYSSCVANLNKVRIRAKGPAVRPTGTERRATKQQNRKLRKTHTAFPKYGKKAGERQKSTCRA